MLFANTANWVNLSQNKPLFFILQITTCWTKKFPHSEAKSSLRICIYIYCFVDQIVIWPYWNPLSTMLCCICRVTENVRELIHLLKTDCYGLRVLLWEFSKLFLNGSYKDIAKPDILLPKHVASNMLQWRSKSRYLQMIERMFLQKHGT